MRAHRFLSRSRLLGPNGQPVSTYLYPSPRSNPSAYKPRQTLSVSTSTNFTSADRRESVDISRQLVAQIGDLGTAIREKNSWAFGDSWDPYYMGAKKAWGEEAQAWLKDVWFPACNVRGPLFDFRRSLFLSGVSWDRDGDDLWVLTESESHFPMFAVFPCTRIASSAYGGTRGEVKDGPYKGATIIDGIIFNRDGRAIAVSVIGENGEPPTYISLFDCDLAYEPEWSDQGRGIPRVTSCCLPWMDRQDLDAFLRAGMKRAATMQIQRVTAEGESMGGADITTDEEEVTLPDGTTETREIHMERVGGGGDVIELSAADGEEIKVLDYANPHPNAEAFIERLTRECLSSVGWFYELLNLSSTGRAPSRMVCNLANKSIWARQSTGERRALRMVRWAIAKAMKYGFISKNNDGADPYMWEFGMPGEISIDAGNDMQAARENVKMGLSSPRRELAKLGLRDDVIHGENVEAVERTIDSAKKIAADKGVPWEWVAERLDQRNPNPTLVTQQQQAKQQPQTPTPNKK